jgi:hypothetical protein
VILFFNFDNYYTSTPSIYIHFYIYIYSELPLYNGITCRRGTDANTNNYFNLITERFPGLAFLELSPFDKMQFLIGDISFSLDTNIGLFFDKIGNTMLKHDREVDVICQATFTFSINNFSVSYIFAKDLLKNNHIYIRVKIMV